MGHTRNCLVLVAGFLAGVVFVALATPVQAPSPVEPLDRPAQTTPELTTSAAPAPAPEPAPIAAIPPAPVPEATTKPLPNVDARAIPPAPPIRGDEWCNDGYDDHAESPSGRGYPMIGGPELGRRTDDQPKTKTKTKTKPKEPAAKD